MRSSTNNVPIIAVKLSKFDVKAVSHEDLLGTYIRYKGYFSKDKLSEEELSDEELSLDSAKTNQE